MQRLFPTIIEGTVGGRTWRRNLRRFALRNSTLLFCYSFAATFGAALAVALVGAVL